MAKKGKVLQTIIDISGEISPTLGKALDSVTEKLDGVNMKALAVGAAAATVAAAAAAGFAKATEYLTELGTEYDKAANDMAASTGLVGNELADLESVMQGVYENNFGDSMSDAADGVAEMYRQTGLLDDELQAATEGAFALRDTFGYELSESARAAKAMMTNFGISGEKSMGLIAAGAQNGLDYSGELIDSINEYSVQFDKLGFSADEMFHVFQAGAENGAWNLDKVGDAIKEFSIRSIDGSKTTIHAFESLGLNAEEMMGLFAAGGDEASVAFQGVVAALMSVDDEVERDMIGVELFGTQWEDLGVDAIAALADISNQAYDSGEALDKINQVKYNDLDSAMQGIKRQIEVALIPAAQSVTDAFIEVTPKIQELLKKAEPVFTKIAESIGPVITGAIELAEDGIGFIIDNMDVLVPIVTGLTAAFAAYKAISAAVAIAEGVKAAVMATGTATVTAASVATWALNGAMAVLTSPITLVVAAIGLLVAAGVALYRNWDVVKEKALQLGSWLNNIWTNVSNAVGNMIARVGEYFPIFGAYLSGWWDSISAAVENIKAVFRGVIDFISNVFAGNWSAAWDNVISIFGNLFGGLANLVKAPINGVISAINSVIGNINKVGFKIPDWVPAVGGKLFSINIPKIPMFAAGGFTNGISIAGEEAMEAIISFDPAYREENLSYWARAGQMLGADFSDFTLDGGSSTTYDLGGVTFAPNITITGSADKQTIMEAIEAEYPEFIDMLEEWFLGRGEPVYG